MAFEQTMIEINYTPSTFTTAEAEIQFRTSEFDSQPVLCRIVGNALPTRQNVGNGAKDVKPEEEADFEARKVQTRTLLTNNRKELMGASSRAGIRLDKLPEEQTMKSHSFSVEPMDRNNLGATDTKDVFVPKTVNKE